VNASVGGAWLCWLAAALAAGCAVPPSPLPQPSASQGFDAQRYESCPDQATQAIYQRALDRLQAADEAAALPLLAEVVAKCPEHVVALAYYQDAALRIGGEAEQRMRAHCEGMSSDDPSPVPAFAKARLLSSNFARKTAIDELLKRHPDFAYGWLALGRLHRSIGRLPDAVAGFQAAVSKHPRLLAAHLELAECLAESGRLEESQVAYENYLRAAPNDRATVRAYVQLMIYRSGKPEAARPWIDRLLAEDSLDESVRMDLAACDWRSGRVREAMDGYIDALQRRPENARAALNIGYLHFDALARTEAEKREHWPKARAAFLLFLQMVRPADGYDYFERSFAVPFRLKQIEELLGPAPSTAPTLADLR